MFIEKNVIQPSITDFFLRFTYNKQG